MDFLPEIVINSPSHIGTSTSKPAKVLAQDALEANKRLQHALTDRAEKLEAELRELDKLLAAATVEESQDEPESEVSIPGAKKATGLFPASEFLNPASPFYDEAEKRSNYIANTNPHPLKSKDLETLADAVGQENERLQAYNRSRPESSISVRINDVVNNIEGLDWVRIAEKVSDASSVKRTATECRISWIADKHPNVNHSEWSADEIEGLNFLVSEYTREKKAVNWAKIAEKLRTHRIPIDCMRHGIPRHRHTWSPESDQKLLQAVELCGIDNWQLVARTVSEHVSAGQCQNRWQKTLNPALRKGAWTEDEDDRLRKAVVGYGSSWIQVATAIPGRTNDQCRERWTEHVKLSSGKVVWTDEEDQILLDSVKEVGNIWKAISVKLGNNKTGQNCRMRYDKLIRNQKNANKLGQSASSSNVLLQPATTPLSAPSMHEFSLHNSEPTVAVSVLPSQSKGKAKVKPKSKSQPSTIEGTPVGGLSAAETGPTPAAKKPRKPSVKTTKPAEPTAPAAANAEASVPPKPRPKPRPKAPQNSKTAKGPSTTPIVPANPDSEATIASTEASIPATSEVAVPNKSRGAKRNITDEEEPEIDNPPAKKVKTTKAASRNGKAVEHSAESLSSAAVPLSSAVEPVGSTTNDSMDIDNPGAEQDSQEKPQPKKRARLRKRNVTSADQEETTTPTSPISPAEATISANIPTRRSMRQRK